MHLGTPFRALDIDKGKSYLPVAKNSGKQAKLSLDDNLIIHGDNLHALKALLPRYAGRIKCIYIDPPYNTGNEGWIYNDNVKSPQIKDWLKKEVGVDDLERHDKWLCMMWPRLQLLRELLAEDGVIFVSIDDNEQFRLTAIMEEIFGEENYVTHFIWEKKKKPSFLHKNVGVVTDFILCYLKNKEKSFPFSLERTTEGKKYPLNRAGNRESILKFPKDSVQFSFEDQTVEPQDMSEGEIKTKLMNKLIVKNGTNVSEFSLKGEWGYSQKTLNKIISEGGSISISKVPFRPNHIKAGGDIKKMKNLLSFLNHYKIPTNEDATKEIINIFGKPVFTNPKPSGLIKKLVQAVTYNDKKAIVLDSFAGSGTTAHAVLDLNKEDGGHRKFILIECEDYAHKITAERVRRVIKGSVASPIEKGRGALSPLTQDPSAMGFRSIEKGRGALSPPTRRFTYCSLGEEINGENLIKAKNLPSYDVLARYVFHTATGETLDTLTENKDFYVGKTKSNLAVFMVYKPDKSFLMSNDSALNLDREKAIQNMIKLRNFKKAYVFAMACFVPTEELSQKKIMFCQIPFAIHKINQTGFEKRCR